MSEKSNQSIASIVGRKMWGKKERELNESDMAEAAELYRRLLASKLIATAEQKWSLVLSCFPEKKKESVKK